MAEHNRPTTAAGTPLAANNNNNNNNNNRAKTVPPPAEHLEAARARDRDETYPDVCNQNIIGTLDSLNGKSRIRHPLKCDTCGWSTNYFVSVTISPKSMVSYRDRTYTVTHTIQPKEIHCVGCEQIIGAKTRGIPPIPDPAPAPAGPHGATSPEVSGTNNGK
jgi:hypothetical protein